ncbi:MAG TPA: hypothetical protein VI078_07735 [bacterium]
MKGHPGAPPGFSTGRTCGFPDRRHQRLAGFLPYGVLAATFAAMAAVSWYRWPEVLVDYGRELYVPWRITEGAMLYRDLPHFYGPLAHYGNAVLFSLFGVSLRTLATFNLLAIGLLALGIYRTFRNVLDRLTATLCAMVFLCAFAFSRNAGQGNWNFVCPYAHEVTYGLYLAFLLLPALCSFHRRRHRLSAGIVGVLLGLIFLTKVEVFAAALLTTVVVAALPPGQRQSPTAHGRGSTLAVLAAGFVVPPLLFVALFSSRGTVAGAMAMVATTVTAVSRPAIVRHPFYLGLAGLDAPVANLVAMFTGAAVYGVLGAAVALISTVVGRHGGCRRHRLLVSAMVVGLAVCGCLLKDRDDIWLRAARPLPFFMLAAAGWQVRRLWNARRDGRPEPIWLLVYALFALGLLAKMILRVELRYYGFALALPAALVFVAMAAHHLPNLVGRLGGCASTARILVATLVLVFLGVQVESSRKIYALMDAPVGSGPDRFFSFGAGDGTRRLYSYGFDASEVAPAVNETLGAIEALMPRDAGFVVVPEGVMLNYLARRRNPARWFEFTPQYVANVGEERMRDDLESARPDYVLLTERPTPEHLAEYFGTDYGLVLRDWIMDHYTPVHLAGRKVFSRQGFGIAIARRNDARPARLNP